MKKIIGLILILVFSSSLAYCETFKKEDGKIYLKTEITLEEYESTKAILEWRVSSDQESLSSSQAALAELEGKIVEIKELSK